MLPQVSAVLAALREAGTGEVLDDFARRGVAAEQVGPELEHIWWASLALDITEADPRCRDHNGPALHQAAERYRALDREQRDETAAIVRARVDQQARWRLGTHPHQVELLRAQAAGERWLLPFHDVFRECEDVVTALHPCLAMSPYAVAQLLPPGTSFDLVVVQDASSLPTAEAVSALSRGRQALVVGDPQGVPPSSFVVGPSSAARVSGAEAGQPRALLDEASALLPSVALDCQHGAADVRLVSWPTGGAGITGAPRPTWRPPIQFELVNGTASLGAGDDSAIEWTRAEVERIVSIVMDHARSTPELSLGVLALTAALATEVEATLREQLHALARHDRTDSALAFFDRDVEEPFVVSSLGRAFAGRDVIVLGVGYGRTLHGRVLHRFPSLGAPGAEQRLARAAGLARQTVVVVSSLSAADLDPARLKGAGPGALRELLARAEVAATADQSSEAADPDPLLDDLAARLRQEGLLVQPRLGSGRYPVELAVGHPSVGERFLVAVETDGPEYAGLGGTRARDRLRVEQLKRLGWAPLRVWTTDLYRDPAREVARIIGTVREARRAGRAGEDKPGADAPAATPNQDRTTPEQDAGPDSASPAASGEAPAPVSVAGSRRRRRRLRRTAEQSGDDTDRGWSEATDDAAHEVWLQEQRPPHWE